MNLTMVARDQNREAGGNRSLPGNSNRHRALARLYERRAAVDQLINALERYEEGRGRRPEQARFAEFSAIGMLS